MRLKNLYSVAAMVFVAAGMLFILLRKYHIFDEFAHMIESAMYADNGIAYGLKNHHNEAGVFCNIIWSALGRFFTNKLFIFRILSWLCTVMILFWVWLKNNEKFYFAALIALGQFHALLLSASVHTEIICLAITVVGLYLFFRFEADKNYMGLLLAAAVIGIGIVSRFYSMAIVPALGIWLFFKYKGDILPINQIKKYLLFFIIAVTPLAYVFWQWGGLTPPKFDEYYSIYKSEVGFNGKRMIAPLLYLGIYTFYWTFFIEKIQPKQFILAFLIGFCLSYWGGYYWNIGTDGVGSGPIDMVLTSLKKYNLIVFSISNLLLTSLGVLSLIFWVQYYLKTWHSLSEIGRFSLFLILFYIIENCFVSGNVPFYERYLFLIYPAIGILIYEAIQPKIRSNKYLVSVYLVGNIFISVGALLRFLPF